MLAVIAAADLPVGIKPSGGISSADDAARYLDLAASTMGEAWIRPATFRFGASSLLTALVDAAGLGDDAASPPTGY